jgi:hypothetical protein
MSQWYYVKGRERVGPVEEDEIVTMIRNQELTEDSFVWKRGFQDWQKIQNVDELLIHFDSEAPAPVAEPEPVVAAVEPEPSFEEPAAQASSAPIEDIGKIDEPVAAPEPKKSFDWTLVDKDAVKFHIKVGLDRGSNSETEYGPYSLNQLIRAYQENRINHKTYIFCEGLDNWMFIADIPVYESLFNQLPPSIEEHERRNTVRRPFVARLLFHDGEQIYEGVCRDVSVGGLQILVANAPCKVGDAIKLNVHPDNSDYHFTAEGVIVRNLGGNQGFSMRFDSLSEDAKRTIENYVKTH